MKSKSARILDVVLFALCAVYFVGTMTFLRPCAAHEDGSWMTCHWAGQALTGVACLMAVLSCVKLALNRAGVKLGIAVSMVPAALLAIGVPGTLIHLCVMDTMRCRAVMRPGAIVFGVLIAALSVVDALVLARAEKRA